MCVVWPRASFKHICFSLRRQAWTDLKCHRYKTAGLWSSQFFFSPLLPGLSQLTCVHSLQQVNHTQRLVKRSKPCGRGSVFSKVNANSCTFFCPTYREVFTSWSNDCCGARGFLRNADGCFRRSQDNIYRWTPHRNVSWKWKSFFFLQSSLTRDSRSCPTFFLVHWKMIRFIFPSNSGSMNISRRAKVYKVFGDCYKSSVTKKDFEILSVALTSLEERDEAPPLLYPPACVGTWAPQTSTKWPRTWFRATLVSAFLFFL